MVLAGDSISVVICTQDSGRFNGLLEGIDALLAQTRPAREILVVVDHNPELRRHLESAMRPIRLVDNSAAPGLSYARNAGLEASTSELVAYLDDDAVPESDWLAELGRAFDRPEVLAAGGAAEPVWERKRPSWFPDEFAWVVGCSYRGLPAEPASVRNVMGCNMAFRRPALAALGGFSQRLSRSVTSGPVGAEETEFCIRLRRRFPGAVIEYRPAARVHHRVPAGRGTWRYYTSRCYHEGLSKGILTRMVGTAEGLSAERRHTFVTLPRGVLAAAASAIRGDVAGLGRAAAISIGFGLTVAGYLRGLRTDGVERGRSGPAKGGTLGA